MNPADALMRLIEPIRPQMVRAVWRVLRNADDADDALQDALATIWKRRAAVLSHPNPSALIVTVCLRAALDRLRRRTTGTTDPLPAMSAATDAVPLDQLIEKETRATILLRIAALPARQSEAILLRAVEGMDYEEIGRVMDCDPATVRTHVRRARERLAHDLSHLLNREPCHDPR